MKRAIFIMAVMILGLLGGFGCFADTLYTCDFSQDIGWATLPGHDSVFSINGGLCYANGKGNNSISYFYHTETFSDFTFSVNMAFNDPADTTDMAGICFRLDTANFYMGYYFYISPDNQFTFTKIRFTDSLEVLELKNCYHSFIQAVNNNLKVALQGGHLKFYINNVLVLDTTDAEFSAGNIGLTVKNNAKVIFDDVVVENTIDTAGYPAQFSDNFNDGDLLNWMKAKVDGNNGVFQAAQQGLQATGAGSAIFYTFLTSGAYKDFTLSANTGILDTAKINDGYVFGLFFRGDCFGKGYYFGITENQFYMLVKILPDTSIYLKQATLPNTNITKGANALSVRALGDSIHIYANAKELFSCVDNAFSGGSAGIFVTSSLSIQYDDFTLMPIPTTVLAWEYDHGTTGFQLSASPNPFNRQVRLEMRNAPLGSARGEKLEIFSINGKLIYSALPALSVVEGRIPRSNIQTWDGRDNRGRQVSPGPYLVRLTCGQSTVIGQVIRVR